MSKILLIEDDPIQTEIIRKRLQSEGYGVLIARKAAEGIEMARKEKPALIIMDMILPGMHGLEASMKLLEMPETKNIPIVALTGMTLPKFVEECYRVGIKDFLKKPFDPHQLLKIVEKYVGKPRMGGLAVIIAAESTALTQLIMHLIKMSFRVELLSDPQKDFSRISKLHPDIVFIETSPGEESCERLVRQLKSEEAMRPVPLILFSSEASGLELATLIQKWGADDFLKFPFDHAALTEVIHRNLRS